MIRLAKQYGWYGYRKVTALLRIEGWRVNHKKIESVTQHGLRQTLIRVIVTGTLTAPTATLERIALMEMT
jgi:hypothetical protein